jgi:hypothetical protein
MTEEEFYEWVDIRKLPRVVVADVLVAYRIQESTIVVALVGEVVYFQYKDHVIEYELEGLYVNHNTRRLAWPECKGFKRKEHKKGSTLESLIEDGTIPLQCLKPILFSSPTENGGYWK